jgi:uncharacterized protein (DUF58 family)
VLRRRSAVFLLSDFLFDEATDPGFRRAAGLLAREHDLVPIRLTDPGAAELPDVGLLVLVDPETGRRHVVDTSSRKFRTGYAQAQVEQRAALTSLFQDLHLDVIEVDTSRDPVPALVGFFRQRERASR